MNIWRRHFQMKGGVRMQLAQEMLPDLVPE